MKNTLKKILTFSLTLCLILSLSLPMAVSASDIRVVVNMEYVDFTGDQPPEIDAAGRTLVPIRRVFERLGPDVKIEWFDADKMACLTKGVTTITLVINNPWLSIYDNGQGRTVLMDTVPVIKNGRTMLPARYVAEALGANVWWQEDERTVYIQSDYTVVSGYVGNANLALVSRNGKYGCIDQNRKIVIPIEYDSIEFDFFGKGGKDANIFNNDRYAVVKATKGNVVSYLGVVREHTDKNGYVIPARMDVYDEASELPGNNSYLTVRQGAKWGIIAQTGEAVVPIEYDEQPVPMIYGVQPRIKVKKNGLYGIATLDNQLITPIAYNAIGHTDFSSYGTPVTYYSEGYVCALRNGGFGYIDMNGQELYPFSFLEVSPIRNGKASVFYNGSECEIQIKNGRITFLP